MTDFAKFSRRGAIAGLTTLAAAATLSRSWAEAPRDAASARPVTVGLTIITKNPNATAAELMDYYENQHVPSAMKSPMRFFPRYARNYVTRVIGQDRGVDCIMEAIPTADFPQGFACGRTMDHTWSRAVSGEASEHILHGPAWVHEPGPIAKRAYLIDAPNMSAEAVVAAATKLADPLRPVCRRISLYVLPQVQDTFKCVAGAPPAQAILMVWPQYKASVPEQLPVASDALRVASVLDLIGFSSDIPVKA